MTEVGQILINKRKSLGYDIYDIAGKVKIRSQYIIALEQGTVDLRSVSEVYMIGYLRIYAKFLGLDPDDIVHLYKNDLKDRNRDLLINEPFDKDYTPSSNVILFSIFMILTIFSSWYLFQSQTIIRPSNINVLNHVVSDLSYQLNIDQIKHKLDKFKLQF